LRVLTPVMRYRSLGVCARSRPSCRGTIPASVPSCAPSCGRSNAGAAGARVAKCAHI